MLPPQVKGDLAGAVGAVAEEWAVLVVDPAVKVAARGVHLAEEAGPEVAVDLEAADLVDPAVGADLAAAGAAVGADLAAAGAAVELAVGLAMAPAVNRIRGNVMEQYTNSGFDAHPYPLNVAESPQIPAYRETFGFSLGGPLVIPHVYRGGNKTSWFASYNLQRGRTGRDTFSTVPTAAERMGDFSSTVITSGTYAGTVPTLYDPTSSATGARTAFSGNVIPQLRLDSAATGMLKYIPLPNLPGTVQNFHLQVPLPSSNDRVMGRIGQQIDAKDSLNVMYFFNSTRSQSVANFPELTSHATSRGQNLSVSESHTFNSHLVNNLHGEFQSPAHFNAERLCVSGQRCRGNWGLPGFPPTPLIGEFRRLGLPILEA